VLTIESAETIRCDAEMMVEHGDLDLVKLAATEDLAWRTALGSAATPALMIAPDETLRRAAQLMGEHEVTHLFLVEPTTTKPLGVLSTLDLAEVLAGVAEPALA
jgi:CBS domain-containing protein